MPYIIHLDGGIETSEGNRYFNEVLKDLEMNGVKVVKNSEI